MCYDHRHVVCTDCLHIHRHKRLQQSDSLRKFDIQWIRHIFACVVHYGQMGQGIRLVHLGFSVFVPFLQRVVRHDLGAVSQQQVDLREAQVGQLMMFQYRLFLLTFKYFWKTRLYICFIMIERSQYPELSFIHGGVRYNFNSSRWSEISQIKFPLENELDASFDPLSLALLKNSIFTLLPTYHNNMSLCSTNLITEKVKKWGEDEKGLKPKSRNHFIMIEHKNQLFIFGGNKENQFFNDLRSFNTYAQTWTLHEEKQNSPSPRVPLIFCSIQHEFIFLFGGRNETSTLSDGYAFYDDEWYKLQCEDLEHVAYISTLKGMKYCVAADTVYVFGGNDEHSLSNNFFSINVNIEQKIFHIKKIKPYIRQNPMARTCHGMVSVTNKFVVVAGGIGEAKHLLDINVYDIEQNYWFNVNPMNGPLQNITDFSLISYKNSLYLCGGSKNGKQLNRVLKFLTFGQYELIKSQLCSQCQIRLQNHEKEDFHSPKKPFVSNGFIHNLALEINFPYQAIGLIVDVAKLLNAQKFTVETSQAINGLTFYLTFVFDGDPLKREEFTSIISHSYSNNQKIQEISDKLKFGSQRLGKTLVFVTIHEGMRRVFMFSSDSLVASHYDQLYSYYAYEERISDKWISTYEGIMHHKFIFNILKTYLHNPEATFHSVEKHAVFIFENNLIMSGERVYYTQLIAGMNDIHQCKNTKKIEFLSGVGFKLQNDPQISLKAYLTYLMNVDPIPKIVVQGSEFYLDAENNIYLNDLKKLQSINKITKIKEESIKNNDLQFQVTLYKPTNDHEYIPQLKGILIYYRNRLINRYDCEFGNLFWEKFYRTKYRKVFPIWQRSGIINIINGIEPKSTMGGFKVNGNYRKFLSYIKRETKVDWSRKGDYTLVIDEEGDDEQEQIKKKVKKSE